MVTEAATGRVDGGTSHTKNTQTGDPRCFRTPYLVSDDTQEELSVNYRETFSLAFIRTKRSARPSRTYAGGRLPVGVNRSPVMAT